MVKSCFTQICLSGEDSDSECHTSSTEDSPQAGPPSGARAPQKRERPRKKPAPQAPRNVAIPVAMPIAPAVIPPRLPPPTQVRTPAESEQGEILLIKIQGKKLKHLSIFHLYTPPSALMTFP